MTDYCTSDDVKENLKAVDFSANTSVTTTAIGNIITQESAVIDAHIQQRYAVPPTEATSLEFLKQICITLCVYRVTKVLQPKEALPVPDNKATQVISHSAAYKQAMNMLKAIRDGDLSLPDEEKKIIASVSSTAVNDDDTFVFESSEQQW